MRLFTDGHNYVVADDQYEALRLWCVHDGEDPNQPHSPDVFEPCDDCEQVSVWLDSEGGVAEIRSENAKLTMLPASEWVRRYGKGWLCSTEV